MAHGEIAIAALIEQAEAAAQAQSDRAGRERRYDRAKQYLDLAAYLATASQRAKELEARPDSVSEEQPREQEPVDASREPLFFVRDGTLVKRGYSRTPGEVYEHTIDRTNYHAVINLVAPVVGKQRAFDASGVLKLWKGPIYLVYLALAALRDAGVLTAPRRGRFEVVGDPVDFKTAALAAWDRIATRGVPSRSRRRGR